MYAHTSELPNFASPRTAGAMHRRRIARPALVALVVAASASVASTVSLSSERPIQAPAGVTTSLDLRPSHHGRYRAEVVETTPIAVGATQRWTVRLARRSHRRLNHAIVEAHAWMPETGAVSPTRPTVRHLGRGRYVLDGLRFTRAGWWNVALVVRGDAGTDSLAFNVVLR